MGVPGRYAAAIAVMEHMHWSYEDYCAAPEDLIEELETRLAADAHWRHEKEKRDEAKRRAEQAIARARGRHGR